MNNAKMWLVVSPTVGVPLFLGGVAVASFAVHMAIIGNTTWIEQYHQGVEMGSELAAATIEGTDSSATKASYVVDPI